MSSSRATEPVVQATGVTKVFQLGELASLQRTVSDIVRAVLRRPRRVPSFRALSEVSFEIYAGECFTVLGHNGSGKTTLLSILSGITLPSHGTVSVPTRVLPLLSVGSAFHQELTGRENAVLFGSFLGLSRHEVERALPDLMAFAGLDEQHMGTPVKRFSEGMKARLAFAIALHFPAELYIFDEVLTFTDDEFKAACVREISRLVADGKSVIFVSHELDLVRSLCQRGMWLENGCVRRIADIDELVEVYAEARAPVPAQR
jgi:ABC-type polysaccharide/polyol phosphate transport system ATPase subunit